MFDSVNACGAAAAVGEDLPPAGPDRARIDRTHHALIAELARHFADQLRPGDGRRIDRNLVGSGKQQGACILHRTRSEEHTSELQSLMRISYAVFCLKKKNNTPLNSRTETLI